MISDLRNLGTVPDRSGLKGRPSRVRRKRGVHHVEARRLTSKTYSCTNCHLFNNSKDGGPYGPNLTHLASRTTFAGGKYELNKKNLLRWVQNAPGLISMSSKDCRIQPPPKNVICVGMPSFTKNTPHGAKQMTPEDANTIVTYLMGEK